MTCKASIDGKALTFRGITEPEVAGEESVSAWGFPSDH